MRKNQTSLTAAGITVMRAVESEKSADNRICCDPYARQFIPAWMYHVLGFFTGSGDAEWRGPGVIGFLAARDRYMGDVLRDFLKEGMQQSVILGAGYDSRAYRFDLKHVRTFEVDERALLLGLCSRSGFTDQLMELAKKRNGILLYDWKTIVDQ